MEGTGQVGGAFEGRVVMDHDGAVGGEAHVELEGVHAEVGGPLEGGEGVLGGFGRGAPVRHEGVRARVHQDVHWGSDDPSSPLSVIRRGGQGVR